MSKKEEVFNYDDNGVMVVRTGKRPWETVDLSDISTSKLADLAGDCRDEVTALQLAFSCFTFLDKLEKELISRLNNQYEPTDVVTVTGKSWEIEALARGKKAASVKDSDRAREMLGDETYFKIAKVGVTDLRTYLNPEQLKEVLDEDNGFNEPRKLKYTPLKGK